ncbi:hypothetical protein HY3_02930 [Hyphomonas pacifica]|uniref:Uncharacterized protein n=1 Tax=Hyphomonas pacifica TaxID=1280941 RepID=A0A062TVS1_9PROT|nr:hypothetical protein HY2_09665 [Hyphomonas pacifica]RAN32295.1 hypothetical protein HY3_02930 [Hyphomonas pacifica]
MAWKLAPPPQIETGSKQGAQTRLQTPQTFFPQTGLCTVLHFLPERIDLFQSTYAQRGQQQTATAALALLPAKMRPAFSRGFRFRERVVRSSASRSASSEMESGS